MIPNQYFHLLIVDKLFKSLNNFCLGLNSYPEFQKKFLLSEKARILYCLVILGLLIAMDHKNITKKKLTKPILKFVVPKTSFIIEQFIQHLSLKTVEANKLNFVWNVYANQISDEKCKHFRFKEIFFENMHFFTMPFLSKKTSRIVIKTLTYFL